MSTNNLVCLRHTPDDKRINALRKFFFDEFEIMPKYFIRVPGRVNLIGEHVDYCGYPVLPMAIEQNILLAVAPTNDCIMQLKNINPKYKSYKCSLDSINIDTSETGAPIWYNYFLCGVQGVIEYNNKTNDLKLQNGMMVAVSGNIPPASGLSSSSALVSAATLCTSFVNEITMDKEVLATISANCERYIGTQGGGMDQAIAFLAQKGCAQFIDWNPLTATPINLPNNAVFVIANSLSEANKAATSDFNQRVIECRLACRMIACKMGLNWRDIDRFSVLQKTLNCSLDEIENFANTLLVQEQYSREDILREFSISEEEFVDRLLTPNTRHSQTFKLRQRALHVFRESLRVLKFRSSAADNDDIKELSYLMRQSHKSLQELYECSHPKLDSLIAISDNFGVSARLTGAGWGGCIVALCDSVSESKSYIEELKKLYYSKLPQANELNFDDVVFATSPQQGAEVFVEDAF